MPRLRSAIDEPFTDDDAVEALLHEAAAGGVAGAADVGGGGTASAALQLDEPGFLLVRGYLESVRGMARALGAAGGRDAAAARRVSAKHRFEAPREMSCEEVSL